jgi:hypothetical protein
MKAVTEFSSILLNKAMATKATLTGEGKTPEEVQTSLGETYKLEGDKLKYFVAALDIAAQNPKDLKRVMVCSLAEGEAAPAKATKVEEMCYIPEYLNMAPPAPKADAKGGRGGGRRGGKGGDRPKGSPWGMTPEEKAAKGKGPAPKQ